MKIYDWNKINIDKKAKISKNKPILIIGSRELSKARILQINEQLPFNKKVLWGILKDEYILGLEESPQFKTLKRANLEEALVSLNDNVQIIEYFQRDTKFLVKELDLSAVILVNGSWYRMLHLLAEFWEIINKKIPYKLISPFIDDIEAKKYVQEKENEINKFGKYNKLKKYSDKEMMRFLNIISKKSYATDDRGGCILSLNNKILIQSHNEVVPYETYAMHYGSIKEKNFSPRNDLNFYDTNHYEVSMLLKAVELKISLAETTLYLSVMPCPTCARMISKTMIKKIIYQNDHSEGYAIKLLESAGKVIRRLVI